MPSIDFHYIMNSVFLITSLFMPQSITSQYHIGNPFNGVTWSLVYELIISFTLPVYYYLISKSTLFSSFIFIGFLFILSNVAGMNRFSAIIFYSIFFVIGSMLRIFRVNH